MVRRLVLLALLAVVPASGTSAIEYRGLCEASAGAFITDTHFAVASDETNRLHIYERGKPDPVGTADMQGFTSFDKSDLEGAARIGDRVYWISSHSFNSKGKDNAKRKVFFATKVEVVGGKPTLTGVGQPIKSMRDALAAAAGVKPSEMNVEGLAATPQGELLIGLRAPLNAGKAIVVPFKNPAAVVDQGAQPDFGASVTVDLEGRGIRSMELIGANPAQYIIAAGSSVDKEMEFALFRWTGPGGTREKIDGVNLGSIKPEGVMAVPNQRMVQLLSDDGDVCSDEDDPPADRKFRSIDVTP